MFCPKCSRPVGEGVQFCQQCGLALEGVRKLLEGEAGAAAPPAEAGPRGLSPRQKGYRQGFKLVLLAALVLAFYPVVEGLLDSVVPSVENTRLDELPLEAFGTLIFVIFAGGLARMLYSRLFESGEASGAPGAESEDEAGGKVEGRRLFGGSRRRALPPSQSIPAEGYAGASHADTADPARPRSVTEHTTRSLRLD